MQIIHPASGQKNDEQIYIYTYIYAKYKGGHSFRQKWLPKLWAFIGHSSFIRWSNIIYFECIVNHQYLCRLCSFKITLVLKWPRTVNKKALQSTVEVWCYYNEDDKGPKASHSLAHCGGQQSNPSYWRKPPHVSRWKRNLKDYRRYDIRGIPVIIYVGFSCWDTRFPLNFFSGPAMG